MSLNLNSSSLYELQLEKLSIRIFAVHLYRPRILDYPPKTPVSMTSDGVRASHRCNRYFFPCCGSNVEESTSLKNSSFMPPTLKKVGGHIASGLSVSSFVPSFVRLSRFLVHSITLEPGVLMFWKFIYGFLLKKIGDPYFFYPNYLPF